MARSWHSPAPLSNVARAHRPAGAPGSGLGTGRLREEGAASSRLVRAFEEACPEPAEGLQDRPRVVRGACLSRANPITR